MHTASLKLAPTCAAADYALVTQKHLFANDAQKLDIIRIILALFLASLFVQIFLRLFLQSVFGNALKSCLQCTFAAFGNRKSRAGQNG